MKVKFDFWLFLHRNKKDMRTRLVLWSKNDANERYLTALSLDEHKGEIDAWKLPEGVVTDELEEALMEKWRKGEEVEFPQGYTPGKTQLNLTESILPEGVKPEDEEGEKLLKRVQAEWNFLVLSTKMYDNYQSRLDELKDQVDALKEFSNDAWEGLRSFWGKVQHQVRERTLFKDHADKLREETDALFTKMKELRSAWHEKFKAKSRENYESLLAELKEIEGRIEENKNLKRLFEELKKLQQKVRETEFTKGHRHRIWDKIDKAFKEIRRRRFGEEADNITPLQRLEKRYAGLLDAIERMKKSVEYERKNLEFEKKKINQADNQLEAQLRQAKISMIEERLHSKEAKLEDMLKTKIELEAKREKLLAREEERKRREEIARKKKEAEAAARKKIEEEVKRNKEKLSATSEGKQAKTEESAKKEPAKEETAKEEAAEKPKEETKEEKSSAEEKSKKEEKTEEESLLDAIGNVLGESLSDVIDTAKAVASVVGDKLSDKVEEIMEDLSDLGDRGEEE